MIKLKKKKKWRQYILLLPLLCMCSGCKNKDVLVFSTMESEEIEMRTETENFSAAKVSVYVCGAVNVPGVYALDADLRVADAVEAAGGMRKDADTEYVNLAQRLSDGIKIRIPTLEETMAETSQTKLVNINTADETALCTLSGIGSAKAKKIIEYREKNGPFSRIEDIMNVPGIKEAGFEKIKEQITI